MKNAGLWQGIQKASWDAVILEDDFKRALQKDVFGFFSSKDTYKELTLPWKELRKRLFCAGSLSNYFPCSVGLFSMDHLVNRPCSIWVPALTPDREWENH